MRLFRWFILRRVVREPLRSMTTALGIALGVAVIVAIQLTNASALAGFATALNTVSGKTSLEIVGPGVGVDEQRLPGLLWLRTYGDVAPIVEGEFVLRQPGAATETLRVLGVDMLRDQSFRDYHLLDWGGGRGEPRPQDFLALLIDPASAILTARFAGPRGLTVGSTVAMNVGDRIVQLTIRGLLKDEGPAKISDGRFVLMDIAAAQQALGRFGRVDRVEVRLPDGASIDAAETAIAGRLPAGLSVRRPAQRGRQVESMLAAFHLNLTALSYVALLVGLFLVYNTVSVAVLSRRDEIGTLRALGVTRGQVRALFLAEAAALAGVGCAAGVFLGRLLADGTIALTSTTVSVLYIAIAAAPPALGLREVLLAFGLGVPLSLLAAVVPAQEAARVTPVEAIRGAGRVEMRSRFPANRLWIALALLALGAWLATLGPVRGLPLFGYLSAVTLIFGASFLVPAVLYLASHAIERPVRRLLDVEYWLAVNNLSAAVPRLSISVAALAVSLSMMVAIAIMIGSFRETVVYWVSQTLQADLFISPGSGHRAGFDESLSDDVVRLVSASPDVEAVDPYRGLEVPYGETGIRVGGRDLDSVLSHGTIVFKTPADGRAAVRAAIGQDAVLASEGFSLKNHLQPGEDVTLPTANGAVRFRIAAVYYDYSSDRGVLMMDQATFERHYGRHGPLNLSVYLRKGIDPEQARERLLSSIGETHLVLVNTNRSLRAEVLRIFDSTFAITYALELIAIAVAILGVSGTLLTLILEREREFRILRLVGTARRQVRRMVVGEAVLIGAISQAIGLVVGLALSMVLIYVINVQSFGWTIQFHLPVAFLLQSSLLMVLSTALAGLYPASRAVGLTVGRTE